MYTSLFILEQINMNNLIIIVYFRGLSNVCIGHIVSDICAKEFVIDQVVLKLLIKRLAVAMVNKTVEPHFV
jgi:hypothetical protein